MKVSYVVGYEWASSVCVKLSHLHLVPRMMDLYLSTLDSVVRFLAVYVQRLHSSGTRSQICAVQQDAAF
jgi:hypothetical protein